MFTYTIDEELSLKLVELKDAERIFQLTDQSRFYLREWLPWLDYTKTVGDTFEYIKGTIKGYSENTSLTTTILYKGKIAGIAGFNQFNWQNRNTSIGYWLGEGFQGKGIMIRTTAALTNYALRDLNLNRVEIRAAIGNQKSRSIPERLGFTYEGISRQSEWLYDHYVDHAVYSMLAEDIKQVRCL